jgi:Cu/Ag efflux protein CusF
MRIPTKFICLTVLTGLLGVAGAAVAQTSSTNSTPAATAKSKTKSVAGDVTAVNNDAKTITLKNHDKPFSITSKTRITKDKEPATLSDIVVGDHVTIRAKDDENGNPVATTIHVGKPKKAKADAAAAADAK